MNEDGTDGPDDDLDDDLDGVSSVSVPSCAPAQAGANAGEDDGDDGDGCAEMDVCGADANGVGISSSAESELRLSAMADWHSTKRGVRSDTRRTYSERCFSSGRLRMFWRATS